MTTLVVAFLATLFLAACSSNSNSSTTTSSASEELTITDATGKVTVPSNPKRIVVLDLGVADTIRALGHEDAIVGMASKSLPTYLKELGENKNITNVGSLKEVNLEKIAELKPDLIIASGRTSAQLDDFKEIAPTVYFSADSTNYWKSVQANIKEVAKVFGDDAVKEADKQIKDIDEIVTKSADNNKETSKTTLMLLLNEGNIAGIAANGRYSFVYGDLGFKPTSLKIEEKKHGKGGKSDKAKTEQSSSASSETSSSTEAGKSNPHGNSLSYESIAQVNPDLIFVVDRTIAIGGDQSTNSDLLNNELIQSTNAGKNKKIITLSSDLWYLSGGGLESTKLMFEEVAQYAGK